MLKKIGLPPDENEDLYPGVKNRLELLKKGMELGHKAMNKHKHWYL